MVSRLGSTIILRNLDDVASVEAALDKRQFWVISMYRKVCLVTTKGQQIICYCLLCRD